MNNLIKPGDVVKFKNLVHFIVKEVKDGVILVEGNEGVFMDDSFTLTTSLELVTTSDLKRIYRAYKDAIINYNQVKLDFLTNIYTKDVIPYSYKRMILDVLGTYRHDNDQDVEKYKQINSLYDKFLEIHNNFLNKIDRNF